MYFRFPSITSITSSCRGKGEGERKGFKASQLLGLTARAAASHTHAQTNKQTNKQTNRKGHRHDDADAQW